jgi:tetratricopeptide (TPR) repeat protein
VADPWYLAMALNNYGYNRVSNGNMDEQTEQLLAESLRLRRSLGEKRGIGATLGSIAELQLLQGDLDAAATTVEEMLALSKTITHAELISIALNMQGFLYLARGNSGRAAAAFRDSLQRSYLLGFQFLAAEALLGLGEAAAQQGAFSRALRFEVVAGQVINAAGQQFASFHQSATDRIERYVERALGQSARQAIRTAARTVTLDQILGEVGADAVEEAVDVSRPGVSPAG